MSCQAAKTCTWTAKWRAAWSCAVINLTVGPHGRVRAHTRAKDVVIHGKVDGNIQADRVELKKSAIHVGNIVTQRVIIEEGAFFKGTIDIQREEPKPEVKPEPKPAVTAAAASVPVRRRQPQVAGSVGAPAAQARWLEPKR